MGGEPDMKKKLKTIPLFKTEDEEARFWASHDSTDYIDWTRAKRIEFPQLKPTTQTITLRLPLSLLYELKKIANKKDVPYQSLMKVFLDEKIKEKNRRSAA